MPEGGGCHCAWMPLPSPSTGRHEEQNTLPWTSTGERQVRLAPIRPLPALCVPLTLPMTVLRRPSVRLDTVWRGE